MYSPEDERVRENISRLNYLIALIVCMWVLVLVLILSFASGAYLILFFVTAFVFVPLLLFLGYRISKLRRKLYPVYPVAPEPVPVVVYNASAQPQSYTYPLYSNDGTEPKAY